MKGYSHNGKKRVWVLTPARYFAWEGTLLGPNGDYDPVSELGDITWVGGISMLLDGIKVLLFPCLCHLTPHH